jgi:hypothetical protein
MGDSKRVQADIKTAFGLLSDALAKQHERPAGWWTVSEYAEENGTCKRSARESVAKLFRLKLVERQRWRGIPIYRTCKGTAAR